MHRLALITCVVFLGGCAASHSLADRVTSFRTAESVPAVGAVVVSSEGIVHAAADGTKRIDTNDEFDMHDPVHIGSITKTMTAMLAALLVEEGLLDWNTRLGAILPFTNAGTYPEYGAATLEDLLSHQAGFIPLISGRDILQVPVLETDSPGDARMSALRWLLEQPPAARRGKFAYSNASFTVAAVMMEIAAGMAWEDLVHERVFRPLRMNSSGFGWPGRQHEHVHPVPWGHYAVADGWTPIDPNGSYYLPSFLAPAGDVHSSLHDMARYASEWLAAWKGSGMLEPSTVEFMLKPRDGSGIGWGIMQAFGFETVANFIGSAETFLAIIIMIPEADRAFIFVSNAYSDAFEDAMIQFARETVSRHLRTPH